MSQPAAISSVVMNRILDFLAGLFLETCAGNTDVARGAARDLLESYDARTGKELRLAALAIAFGFGALDALSKANDATLTLAQVLRLRGCANALNRSAQQNERQLEKRHKEPPQADAPEDEPLPASTATEDLIAFTRSAMMNIQSAAQAVTAPAAPMSRQQRREAERRAEKLKRRAEEDARLAMRAAALRANRGPMATATV
jgi:hypothetical protein